MKLSIPGKLYITGEYGVIHQGHAIVAPVKRAMHFDIRPHHEDTIASKMIGVKMLSSDNVGSNVYRPYLKAVQYLESLNIHKRNFLIVIQSELNTDVAKLGLGSSGALTIGIIKSILRFHGVHPSPMLLFKLGVLSQIELNVTTSFGDLSVHAFNEWVLYRKFDEAWVKRLRNKSLTYLLRISWKDLKIIPFKTPALYGFALNSLVPSTSAKRVRMYMKRVSFEDKNKLMSFMDQRSIEVFYTLKTTANLEVLSDIHSELQSFSEHHQLNIVTDRLQEIINIFYQLNGKAKHSGAGGGDCVISFFDSLKASTHAKQHFMNEPYPIIEIRGVKSE